MNIDSFPGSHVGMSICYIQVHKRQHMHASAFIYVRASAHKSAYTSRSMHLRAYKPTHFHAYIYWKHADTKNDCNCNAEAFLIQVKSVHLTLTYMTKSFRKLKAQAVPALLVLLSLACLVLVAVVQNESVYVHVRLHARNPKFTHLACTTISVCACAYVG